jgi:hypothetical protein
MSATEESTNNRLGANMPQRIFVILDIFGRLEFGSRSLLTGVASGVVLPKGISLTGCSTVSVSLSLSLSVIRHLDSLSQLLEGTAAPSTTKYRFTR